MNTTSRSMLRLLAVTIITTTSSLLLIRADNPEKSKGSLKTDRHALLAFYNALPSVGTRLDWNWNDPKEKICEWKGVFCTDEVDAGTKLQPKEDDIRVVELRLGGVGLYGAIVQNSIGKLHALQTLVLRNNSLYGTLPTDILSIPTLKYINLQHNKFCGDLPKFSGNPPNYLEVVDLSFNNISGKIPSVFGRAKGLQHLDLQSNLFSGIIPDFNLEHLIKLNLSNNKLQGDIPPSLKKFYGQNSFVGNEDLAASAPLSNAAYSNKLPHRMALMASSLLLFLLLL